MAEAAKRGETIGILYAGDMGAALGKLLRQAGHAVVTTVAGRSPRTERLARAAELCVLPSIAAVADEADVILSTVCPPAALEVAEQFRRAVFPERRCTFVDLNSISPDTAERISRLFDGTQVSFVDGAVHGLAARLRERGVIYLSGASAGQVAELFVPLLRVKLLGDQPGRASAFRMLISGLTKGVIALFLEMGVTAQQAGLLDDLLACYSETYPGVMDIVERILPTYPEHARRRGDEMREVEQMMSNLDLRPCVTRGVRALIEQLGRLELAGDRPGRAWSVREVVEAAQAGGLLHA